MDKNIKILMPLGFAAIIFVVAVLIIGNFFTNEQGMEALIQCLDEAGVVIYGTKTCPACASLVESFGGAEKIEPIYVICDEEWDRCMEEMQTELVPEIQIRGELYVGPEDPKSVAKAVDCKF